MGVSFSVGADALDIPYPIIADIHQCRNTKGFGNYFFNYTLNRILCQEHFHNINRTFLNFIRVSSHNARNDHRQLFSQKKTAYTVARGLLWL